MAYSPMFSELYDASSDVRRGSADAPLRERDRTTATTAAIRQTPPTAATVAIKVVDVPELDDEDSASLELTYPESEPDPVERHVY